MCYSLSLEVAAVVKEGMQASYEVVSEVQDVEGIRLRMAITFLNFGSVFVSTLVYRFSDGFYLIT